MGEMWVLGAAMSSGQSANMNNTGHHGSDRLPKLIAAVLLVGAILSPSLRAQNQDTGAPDMSHVTDVTPGWKYLLQDDDLAMVTVNANPDGTLRTSLVTMGTSNSSIEGTPQAIPITNSQPFNFQSGVVASEASGRMFNTNLDTIAILTAGGDGWDLALANVNGVQSSTRLQTSFLPSGTIYEQVVMGEFNGDGLADPLVFYTKTDSGNVAWGIKALAADSENDPGLKGPRLKEGPEFKGITGPPVAGSVVVGDFNGDGRDEIAALLNDYQTIAFYSVDPNTLAITQTATLQLSANLQAYEDSPVTMTPGQVALAAGHFRQCGGNGSACQAHGLTNADLVVFGQIKKIGSRSVDPGYSVIPIRITPSSSEPGAFTAKVALVNNATEGQPFFRFPNYHGAIGALAQSAPLVYWPQQTDEQLVLGIQTQNGASYIDIGSFLPDDGLLDTFVWQSETGREYSSGVFQKDYLANMWVGNFDHRNPDNSHNAGWQIETYELLGGDLGHDPHINIFDINVPSPYPPNRPGRTNWLKQRSDNTYGIPGNDPGNPSGYIGAPSLGFLAPSDLRGRSLRLGTPSVVRIPQQTQPNLILGVPPMHVDYIAPNDSQLAEENVGDPKKGGCTEDVSTPCIVNLTVNPNEYLGIPGFSSSFEFASSEKDSSKSSSTTSWGISVKQSFGGTISFGDGLATTTQSIKDTVKYGHDGTVKKTYGTYTGMSQSLSATTGFSDFIYYTQKRMNIYYYPVLGCESDAAANCWVDGQKRPMYVQFSVPDTVAYTAVDGLDQDWYQPVHEPGNVFSYPWSKAQLQNQFISTVIPVTKDPTCTTIGTSSQTLKLHWTSGSDTGSSSGSTNAFSNEFSLSASVTAGVEDVGSASANYELDIGASLSLNSLNESTTAISTSKDVSVNVPSFGYAGKCCSYAFSSYIFGLENEKNPASENACKAGQTPEKDGCIAVYTPDSASNQPSLIDIATTGPIFLGFLANPIGGQSTELSCAGNADWWLRAYTKPDVALNHPGRWNWNENLKTVTFASADSTPIIENNYFYRMKGFFISKRGESSGPNLVEASPSAPLTLTTRVYNYSTVNTTAPVHVRFYGQLFCNQASGCKDGNTTCTYGLCGDGFQIGSDQVIPSIAGFQTDENTQNWTTASVDFDPQKFDETRTGNTYMSFWVVVWMEDASGKLVPEMASHGLTSIPASNLTQITQVPFEQYSNNVGLYDVRQPFYICPPSGCLNQNTGLGATPSGGSLKSIHLSIDRKLLLDQRVSLNTTLQATRGVVGPVNITYYDGNPAKGGKLVNMQQIQRMDPGVTYGQRASFTPKACGVHTLYASASVASSHQIQASAVARVTIDPVASVQALINSTNADKITDAQLRRRLAALLNKALEEFKEGERGDGNAALGAYVRHLAAASGDGITADSVSQLTSQTNVIIGCDSGGDVGDGDGDGSFHISGPSKGTVGLPAGTPSTYASR
jgi:hypothetical protein